jgi:hypothetical protein
VIAVHEIAGGISISFIDKTPFVRENPARSFHDFSALCEIVDNALELYLTHP